MKESKEVQTGFRTSMKSFKQERYLRWAVTKTSEASDPLHSRSASLDIIAST